MSTKTPNRRSLEKACRCETATYAVQPLSDHKLASDPEVFQRAVIPHSMLTHSDVPGLQRMVGNRSINNMIGAQIHPAAKMVGNVIQRYEPPSDVTLTPIQQKPYYRIHQVQQDLRFVVQLLSERPPRYAMAKSIVRNMHSSLEGLINPNRLKKVFGKTSGGGAKFCLEGLSAIDGMYARIHFAQESGKADPDPSLIKRELAELKFAVPYFEKLENAVSYELNEAQNLPDVPTKFSRLPRTEAHVLAWLVKYKAVITSAAAKFKVDRRAVAGAIAWEAIIQVKPSSLRAVGPGKAHIWEFWGTSAVDEVEELGYLPDLNDDQQKEVLKTPSGSAQYIAAIMAACASSSAYHGLYIRTDPGVLTTIYQGWSPSEWKDHMNEKAAKHPKGQPWPRPLVQNPMGIWVDQHLPYLEEAVGFTPVEKQALGEKQYKATGEGKIVAE